MMDKTGEAREVGRRLDEMNLLPPGWMWEARREGLWLGTESIFRDALDPIVGIFFRRPARWAWLPEDLVSWMYEGDGEAAGWGLWVHPPAGEDLLIGSARFRTIAETLGELVAAWNQVLEARAKFP